MTIGLVGRDGTARDGEALETIGEARPDHLFGFHAGTAEDEDLSGFFQ